MENAELFNAIVIELELETEKNSIINKEFLIDKINQLILNDFSKLVLLLYKVDVNENKLKQSIKENQGTDAAEIIVDLIIERQLQKIKTREEFKPGNDIPENERW
jgi:hypothetical protein